MRAVLITTVLMATFLVALVGPAASLTFGPPIRAHCPVDGATIDVRPIKSRLIRPIVYGGPTPEPVYECPVCRFSGVAADFPAAPRDPDFWSFTSRAVAASWLRTDAARALPPATRSARLALVLGRPATDVASRFALAAVMEPERDRAAESWREAERALRSVVGPGVGVSRLKILDWLGDTEAADALRRSLVHPPGMGPVAPMH